MADDEDTGDIPAPDAPPSEAEARRAEAFAELVDAMVDGRDLPPAMSTDDRSLLEVATVIHACTTGVELSPTRRDRLVEEALARAVGGEIRDDTAGDDTAGASVTPLRARGRTALPWVVAAVAVAALVVLLVRPRPDVAPAAPQTVERRPETQRSRPADALVGPIDRAEAASASARLDIIHADRMGGYRSIVLAGEHAGGDR